MAQTELRSHMDYLCRYTVAQFSAGTNGDVGSDVTDDSQIYGEDGSQSVRHHLVLSTSLPRTAAPYSPDVMYRMHSITFLGFCDIGQSACANATKAAHTSANPSTL